jgi:hypothetical protein
MFTGYIRVPFLAKRRQGRRDKKRTSQPRKQARQPQLITEKCLLGDWRARRSRMRASSEADPEVMEEVKWMVCRSGPRRGICTGESHKSVVKLTFFKGAVKDPAKLFNSSLEGT